MTIFFTASHLYVPVSIGLMCLVSIYRHFSVYFSMTEGNEDPTRHAGVVTMNLSNILREFDLNESEAVSNKSDTAALTTSSTRLLTYCLFKSILPQS